MKKNLKNKYFGSSSSCFFICEIGINHNGSLKRAKKMIDLAVDAGADAVKFQMRHLKDLYQEDVLEKIDSQDLTLQQSIDFIKSSQLTTIEFKELSNYCKTKNILFLCTPWDMKSLEVLEKLEVPFYKVASADLSNIPFINAILKTKKPIIFSTGMSLEEEIDKIYKYLKEKGADFALLHCNSTYPAGFKDINLRFMQKMIDKYDVPVGYSGHERGIAVSMAAHALGAKIVERHFTLDRNMPGPDHQASLEPDELKSLICGIREIELAFGEENKDLSQGIVMNKETLGKSLIASQLITIGTKITDKMVISRSPGTGISPSHFSSLIGSIANRNIQKNEFFTMQDLGNLENFYFKGKIKHSWGVPARFHDLEEINSTFNPDFLEIHLSYQDVIDQVFPKKVPKNLSLKVHVPDIWPDSFILDLASPDQKRRELSIEYVQKTVTTMEKFSKVNSLKKNKIDYILHVGGNSNSSPITDKKTLFRLYKNVSKSLKVLKNKNPNANFLPENMPPLPWLLGGQRFHNIFTKAENIISFSKNEGFEICLDVSHAYLYCQYSSTDFFEYISSLLPIAKHLHLADARGTDGEGLAIGDGDVEFDKLKKLLDFNKKDISFITEIWQGHQRNGRGFHTSLTKLSELGY